MVKLPIYYPLGIRHYQREFVFCHAIDVGSTGDQEHIWYPQLIDSIQTPIATV